MRVLAAVLCVAACACAAGVRGARGYHADVGIPLAASLRAAEEKIMAEKVATGHGRIIGGVWASPNAHPFFAGLLIDLVNIHGGSVCGSTLVSANRLVTAAHCWFDGTRQAWRFTVVLGTTSLFWGGERIPTNRVFMHPEWTTHNLRNDIAMIHLPFNVRFSASIRPIALPTAADTWNDFAGYRANAVGFGKTSDSVAGASSELKHVDLSVISVQQCLSQVDYSWFEFIVSSTLCTSGFGRVGVCNGDSGGPLTITRRGEPVLIGVTSFAAKDSCEEGWPSGFARVTSFLDFIHQHLW